MAEINETVIKCYYSILKKGLMKLEDIPSRYQGLVEIYYNEMERSRVNS